MFIRATTVLHKVAQILCVPRVSHHVPPLVPNRNKKSVVPLWEQPTGNSLASVPPTLVSIIESLNLRLND